MAKRYTKFIAEVLVLAMMVTLMPVKVEAASKKSLYVGKTTTLKAVKKATWKSSNKKVATVSKKGKVTAKKAGKATITAKKRGKVWKFKLTVKNPYLNRKTAKMGKGTTMKLKLTGASIKSCTSSNEKVASVTNTGTVKAVSTGSAVVSVAASNKKVYKCSITVTEEASTVSEDTPTASQNPSGCTHAWKETSQEWSFDQVGKKCINSHATVTKYQCTKCGETKQETSEWVPCTEDWVVTKEPTCTECGTKTWQCTVCGHAWREEDIPNTGHDFEYDYKKQVVVRDDWDIHYDYNNEHGWEGMGERTATCKTCGESFEEVGFDTGAELEDGSRAVVWGIHLEEATDAILYTINSFRRGNGVAELPNSDVHNKYALFRAAQACARKYLPCKGQMGKGWVTPAGFFKDAPVGEKINIVEGFIKLGGSFASEEMKYSGGAHFRYETEGGEFIDTLVVVGDVYEQPTVSCKYAGHDIDYARACHRCGWQSTWYAISDLEEDESKRTPRTSNPYFETEDLFDGFGNFLGTENHGHGVHIGVLPQNDNGNWSLDLGGFDMDHDGICEGCGGPMISKYDQSSWNYCNLAIFGYGGMEWSDFVPGTGSGGYFKQPNWPNWKK